MNEHPFPSEVALLPAYSNADITAAEREHAAALLRELLAAHERFPSSFAMQPCAMLLFDRAGSLVRANRVMLDALGVEFGAIADRAYGKLVEPARREDVRAAFAAAAAGHRRDLDLRLQVGGGRGIDARVALVPAYVGGEIAGVYACSSLQALDEHTTRRMQTLGSLFGNHGDAVFALDESGICMDVNAACERLLGYEADRVCGRSYASLVAPDARLNAYDAFERALRGESVTASTTLVHRDGRRIEVSGMSVPIVVDGAPVGVYMIGRDVTDQARLAAEVREQAERMRELYLVAASSGQSAEAQIVSALELGCRRLGCEGGYVARVEDELVTYLHVSGVVSHAVGATHPLERSLHRAIVESRRPVAVDDVPGAEVAAFIGTPIAVSGVPFGTLCLVSSKPHDGQFSAGDRDYVRLIGAFVASAIERGAQRRRLDALAFYDQLTGLPNRTLLGDRLQQTIASAERHGTAFALHYYDLDGFKEINDTHGHMSGDDVLRTVARRFERAARQEDTVARIGGDEFVVLQPFVRSRADVESFVQRLRAALGEPLIVEGITYRLTTSAGVAVYPEDGREAAALFARADAALYRVKHGGRNDVAFASAP